MKKYIQLILFFILVIISYFSYNEYFKPNKVSTPAEPSKKKDIKDEEFGNLIKNLKYEVKFENNTEYILSADYSEITYQDEAEIVKMKKVIAFFNDENSLPLIIEAENAIYNNSNYNTKFYSNVVISYMGNTINSMNLDLDFTKNIVTIYNNVVYDGIKGHLKTDNIIINLVTKNIKFFMNNSKDKIEIESK
tara:strand:+ start:146 stop:721 length:576 start_codon:yes stop_codon:yes gene_type:complete